MKRASFPPHKTKSSAKQNVRPNGTINVEVPLLLFRDEKSGVPVVKRDKKQHYPTERQLEDALSVLCLWRVVSSPDDSSSDEAGSSVEAQRKLWRPKFELSVDGAYQETIDVGEARESFEFNDRGQNPPRRWPIIVGVHEGRRLVLDGSNRLARAIESGEPTIDVLYLLLPWATWLKRRSR